MAQSLFDHIKQITNVQNPMYWESLDEGDKKTWSNYMVHRFLSMKSDWIQVVNELQKYWELAPKNVYQFYIDTAAYTQDFTINLNAPQLVEFKFYVTAQAQLTTPHCVSVWIVVVHS